MLFVAADHSHFESFDKTFLVSLYQLLLSARRSLYRRGLNSPWSWNFSPKLINGWVLINKGSENSSLNKQVFCLYTLKSCLWKLQIILHNQVYFSSSIILTYVGYTTVMSFNNLSLMITVVSVKTLEEMK